MLVLVESQAHDWRTLQRNNVLATGCDLGHFYRGFDSLRTRVHEKERVERRVWHEREELLNELQVWWMKRDAALYPAGWSSEYTLCNDQHTCMCTTSMHCLAAAPLIRGWQCPETAMSKIHVS